MSETAWTDHLDGLAKLEDNIGKRVAFETSSEIIQKLEQELADLKSSLPKVRAEELNDFSNQMARHSEKAAKAGKISFACKFAARTAEEQAKLEAGDE